MPTTARDTSTHQPDGVISQGPGPLPPITSYGDAAVTAETLAPRVRLKQAIAVAEAAKSELEKAQALNERAVAMLQKAKAEFNDSQSVHSAVREWKVSSFKKGSAAPLPPDLIEQRREAIFAGEEYEHAEAVAAQMSRELEGAKTALTDAEKERESATNDVVIQSAEPLTAELKRTNERRHQIRFALLNLGEATQFNSNAETNRVLAPFHQSYHEPADLALSFNQLQGKGITEYWRGFRETLLSNPDAPLPGLPALKDIF